MKSLSFDLVILGSQAGLCFGSKRKDDTVVREVVKVGEEKV